MRLGTLSIFPCKKEKQPCTCGTNFICVVVTRTSVQYAPHPPVQHCLCSTHVLHSPTGCDLAIISGVLRVECCSGGSHCMVCTCRFYQNWRCTLCTECCSCVGIHTGWCAVTCTCTRIGTLQVVHRPPVKHAKHVTGPSSTHA